MRMGMWHPLISHLKEVQMGKAKGLSETGECRSQQYRNILSCSQTTEVSKCFPPRHDENALPTNESNTVHCISALGNQLLFTDPHVYDYQVQGAFARDLPALLNASKGKHVREKPWNSQVTLTSKGGKEFISFAKFSFFDDGK